MSKANLAWPCTGAILSIATSASAAPAVEILIGDASQREADGDVLVDYNKQANRFRLGLALVR